MSDRDGDGWTPEWKPGLDDQKFDQEMDDFLLSKAQEGDVEGNRLLNMDAGKTLSSSISTDAIKEALSLCEDQLEKVPAAESAEMPAGEPLEFSSKFGTFRADFMKELEGDTGLSELPIPVSNASMPNGMVQDFLDGFAKSENQSSIESCFAPESDKKFVERSFLGQREDLDEITDVAQGGISKDTCSERRLPNQHLSQPYWIHQGAPHFHASRNSAVCYQNCSECSLSQ